VVEIVVRSPPMPKLWQNYSAKITPHRSHYSSCQRRHQRLQQLAYALPKL
jgi:hypothetical protein